jgi:hypothetical protein
MDQLDLLVSGLIEKVGSQNVSAVFYYGTGIISLELKEMVQSRLEEIFPNAEIHIHSDLLGAVKVTCQDDAGIVSILGTGSNACMFDGNKVVSLTPSLGYMLGDEGSGCDIGKQICRDFYYGNMPHPIMESMVELLPPSRREFLDTLKHHPAVNQYLASFVQVGITHKTTSYIDSLVTRKFHNFFDIHLSAYPKDMKLHAVGSIAYGFKKIFNTIASEFKFEVGNIIRKPIEGLATYHRNNISHGK